MVQIAQELEEIREVDTLNERVAFLICAEQERDLAIAEVAQFTRAAHEMKRAMLQEARAEVAEEMDALRHRVKTLENERNEARTELTRALAYQNEAIRLRGRVNSVLDICAVPNAQLGAYEKLALIVEPEQKTYHLKKNGMEADVNNMYEWNQAIGGGANQMSRIVEKLTDCGTMIRTSVNFQDKREHIRVEVNPAHLANVTLIRPDQADQRKNNGGDRRCTACGGKCKKHFAVTFECMDCGIDYDFDMKPIDHTPAAPAPAPMEEKKDALQKINKMLNVLEQPELKEEPTPITNYLRRPAACTCNVRFRWIERGGETHCTVCEPTYRMAVSE